MNQLMLVTRALPTVTPRQLQALRAVLPSLAQLDLDELELALELLPICTLAWCEAERGHQIANELAAEGLAVELMDVHELHRALLGQPPHPDALVELELEPTFHPPTLIRASQGDILEVWHFDVAPLEGWPLAQRLGAHGGLDLETLATKPAITEVRCSFDAATRARLDAAIARVREGGDELSDSSVVRDGIGIELWLPTPPPVRLLARSPEREQAGRLLALVDVLLEASVELLPALGHLTRYFQPMSRPRPA